MNSTQITETLDEMPEKTEHLHPDTFELVYKTYYWKSRDDTWCTPIQQIWHTICDFAPDIYAIIADIQAAEARLHAEHDEEKLAAYQPYLDEFYALVHQTSAELHEQEPAKQKLYAEIRELQRRMNIVPPPDPEYKARYLAEKEAVLAEIRKTGRK
jgi:hypothetical protein